MNFDWLFLCLGFQDTTASSETLKEQEYVINKDAIRVH